MTIIQQWNLISNLPDGHRLFLNLDNDGLAIADDSGDYPDQTDDGVLWLDRDEPLMAGDSYCSIPLKQMIEREFVKTRTPTDVATIFLLASQFDWAVNCRGILFNIYRQHRNNRLTLALSEAIALAETRDEAWEDEDHEALARLKKICNYEEI